MKTLIDYLIGVVLILLISFGESVVFAAPLTLIYNYIIAVKFNLPTMHYVEFLFILYFIYTLFLFFAKYILSTNTLIKNN